jgi:hypothetical protein
MEYMILIHSDENYEAPAPGTPAFEAMMAPWMAFNQRLIDDGHWIASANLQPTPTATTVHKRGDAGHTMTDGPYAESKEQMGGFYLVRAADLDEAIERALAIPMPFASFEVRPVAFRPDAF